ncbi:hypothetical protein [Aeoliella sp.]|uniref:hypothetical protein n=1 Tax=Aeoliella sp. TaxID=2795800 RepID=UPI003CCBC780
MLSQLKIAEQFARALDAEDYQQAEVMLSPGCEYVCRGRRFVGPESIIDSYRQSGEGASHQFDRVEYESSCELVGEDMVLIRFVDRLTKAGQSFTFECQQLVQVDQNGQIVRIDHQDIPGAREALEEFTRNTRQRE